MRIAALIVLTLIAAGCARIHVHHDSDKDAPTGLYHEKQKSVFLGLEPISTPVDLHARCPNDSWEEITMDSGWASSGLRLITLNMYSPWDVETVCSVTKSARKVEEEKQPF